MIEATAVLRRRGRLLSVVVGEGRRRPSLEALAEQAGVATLSSSPVTSPTASRSHYALLDVFVVPRRDDVRRARSRR